MPTRKTALSIFHLFAFVSAALAMALFVGQLIQYSDSRARLQANITVGGISVGGLTTEEAQQRVARTYAQPVELLIADQRIVLDPQVVSFSIHLENMLALADTNRSETPFWQGFWRFLWMQPEQPTIVLLDSQYDARKLRSFLLEVAARYNVPPSASEGTALGDPGYSIDIESSLSVIDLALHSPTNRRANLTTQVGAVQQTRTETNLADLLAQYAADSGYQGALSVVYVDLQTGEEVVLLPDVVYDGGELLQIPLLLAAYPSSHDELATALSRYVTYAGSPDSDELLAISARVDELLQEMGMKNTTWDSTGLGSRANADEIRPVKSPVPTRDASSEPTALPTQPSSALAPDDTQPLEPLATPESEQATPTPRLASFPTPVTAQRTTAREVAAMLAALYQCAEYNGGALPLVDPQAYTPEQCQGMLDLLAGNQIATLLQVGLPAESIFSRRYALAANRYADAGVVHVNQGAFVLVVVAWQDSALEWKAISPLFADVAQVAYRYFANQHAEALSVP